MTQPEPRAPTPPRRADERRRDQTAPRVPPRPNPADDFPILADECEPRPLGVAAA